MGPRNSSFSADLQKLLELHPDTHKRVPTNSRSLWTLSLDPHIHYIHTEYTMVLKLYGSPVSTCTRRVAVTLKEKNVPFEFITVDIAKGEHKSPDFLVKQPFGQVPYLVSTCITTDSCRSDLLSWNDLGRRRFYHLWESCHRTIHRHQIRWSGNSSRSCAYRRQGHRTIRTSCVYRIQQLRSPCLHCSLGKAVQDVCNWNYKYQWLSISPTCFLSGSLDWKQTRRDSLSSWKPLMRSSMYITWSWVNRNTSLEMWVHHLSILNTIGWNDRRFLQEISLIDLFHLPYGTMIAVCDPEIMTKKPNVARYICFHCSPAVYVYSSLTSYLLRWWNDITSRPSWQAVKDGIAAGLNNAWSLSSVNTRLKWNCMYISKELCSSDPSIWRLSER